MPGQQLRSTAPSRQCTGKRSDPGCWQWSLPAWLEVPRPDPYTGEPLKYAVRDGCVVIYSVGPDGEDDGGEVLRFRGGEKYDLGVFLHDPARRGLPPE